MSDLHALIAMGVIFGYLAGMLVTLCSLGDSRAKPQATLVAGLLIGVSVGLLVATNWTHIL